MKTAGKIAAGVGALLVLSLAALAIAPPLFRDRIEALVKVELNDAVDAEVDWGAARLSVLRTFPNLGLRLDDVSIVGTDRFAGDTLAAIGRFDLVLDLPSVFRAVRHADAIVVRAIELDRPALHLRVLADGTANWDIVRAGAEPIDGEPRPLAISLRRFGIRDGSLMLDDAATDLHASITGLRQSLSGDFAQRRTAVSTRLVADAVSVRFAGIPYLSRVALDVAAEVDADLVDRTFTIDEVVVRLNELPLALSGSVGAAGDDLLLDLSFDAPRTDFRHLLSLVPTIYAQDFETVQTTGSIAVTGRVQGAYGEDAFPAFSLRAEVHEGTFRYPDLPLSAREIFVDFRVENAGGDLDNTLIDLDRFHALIGNDPVDASLRMRTPVSDPDLEVRVAGRVDLADFRRTVKFPGIEELEGVVAANMTARARASDLDAEEYERVTARGGAEVRGLTFRTADLPHPLYIDEAVLDLTPSRAELRAFVGRLGSSDIQAVGHLDNLLGFALRDDALRGEVSLAGSRLVLDEWQSGGELEIIPVPARLDLGLRAALARVSLRELDMSDVRGRLRIHDQRVTLDDLEMQVLGGAVTVSGFYETTDVARPTFDTDLRVRAVDIPGAFAAMSTVRALAPVARYTEGTFSADLAMRGALGADLTPIFDVLDGRGELETSRLVVHEFPAMHLLADLVKIGELQDPVLAGIRSVIEVRDGRLHVQPFETGIGDWRMSVSGSNGFDQSLQYAIRLYLPRSALGAEAAGAIGTLVARAGRAGFDLGGAETIELPFHLTGTVTRPTLVPDAAGVLVTARAGVEQAIRDEATRRLDAVGTRTDDAADEARQRAEAEAERILREAEARAATIRADAERLAEGIRVEGYAQADALLERAGNPLARTAARPAADRLRRESDERAEQIVREADSRADAIVAAARERAGAIQAGGLQD
jgi:vacuolar-type H+-ATPase subunit H